MKLRVTERAKDDIDKIFEYLNERSPQAANDAIRAIRAAANAVAEYPNASPLTSISGVRSKVVRRYGYVVFYRIVADAVELLHVRHGARVTPTTLDD